MATLTLAQANQIVAKALEKARAMKIKPVTVVVLDEAGHLKAMQRERRMLAIPDLALAESAWVGYERDDGGRGYLEALRACLARVRGRAARALELRYRAGSPLDAIARELGLSEAGVKSILVRARSRLRECIERKLVR